MQIETIIRDNREQLPYKFEHVPVEVEDATLRTGDYSLPQLCDWDDENGTYLPYFAIERKTGEDFLRSISTDRERFKAEIKRAADWEENLLVVVEDSWTVFTHNLAYMGKSNVTTNQVEGTVDSWTEHYNVNFFFAGSRNNGERHTFETLTNWLQVHR